ncbi:MAG: polymerase III subunit beta protein [Candidatus Saccharibacteria bacterium GW2011_GWA2_46_10]|nr:MAG: polymerase III subunit beta protein [Candidatus Saccharibacteria bacterium GW2011_GWA2_46_10]
MKFSCKTQELLNALHLVSRAISGQQALPILGNILIEAEGKRCKVSATDLELSIITSFEASIENEGTITIPSKAIINFAQYNTDSEVLLETTEGTQLKCTSKHAKTIIAGEASSEYPTISPIEKEEAFSIDAKPLLDALYMVTFSAAKSTLRPVLSGVYIRTEKSNLVFVSTDSYRLSEHVIPLEKTPSEISCIIPVKVLDELKSILGAKIGSEKKPSPEKENKEEKSQDQKFDSVGITMSAQQVEISVGETKLLSRLIDGKFPDYKQIVPKESKTKVLIQSKELTTAVKRMHYFAKEINNNLTFSFEKNKVLIFTPQTQMGKDEAMVDVSLDGESNKIALSSSYLLDYLSHVDDPEIEIQVTDSMHPAVFHVPSQKNSLHLIMPLRLQEE